jgi:hypothetical protein
VREPNAYADSDTDGYANSHANSDTDTNGYRDANANGYSDADADKAVSDATAAPDAVATPASVMGS